MANHRPRLGLTGFTVLALSLVAASAGCGARAGHRGDRSSITQPAPPADAARPAVNPTADTVGPVRADRHDRAAACQTANLRLSAGRAQQAMQHFSRVVMVRLTGAARCTLVGYPGVLLLGGAGKPLPTRTRRGGSYLFPDARSRPVTLTPGMVASFALGGPAATADGSATCPLTTSVRIIPPGDVTALQLPMTLPDCGQIDVSPMVSGATGPVRS